MARIKPLDSITINKIAAGEVIDRPASIVKELVENSIDANATEIHVRIEDGGKKLIQVSDNGDGIAKDDLMLAPIRHTTSKIQSLEDIYATTSFGFRGEALSSIAHAASLVILSRPRNNTTAYSVSAYQDHIQKPVLANRETGTTIQVEHLFSELPVRLKFLKSNGTEMAYINEVLSHFILSHPHVDFKLSHNSKDVLNSTGISDPAILLTHLYGRSIQGNLIPIDERIASLHLTGYISSPTLTFPNRNKQTITVNHRLVKNALFHKALENGLRDYIPARRFPLTLLNLSLEQDHIDVNIHPQKQDIKFLDPGFIFDAVKKGVQLALENHTKVFEKLESFHTPSLVQAAPSSSHTPQYPPPTSTSDEIKMAQSEAFSPPPLFKATPQTTLTPSQPSAPFWQLFNTYIAIHTPEGMWLLDQHAVHERILYEKIKKNATANHARQALLLSEIIDLDPSLYSVYEEEKDYLNNLNFTIDPFGNNQVAVREIPTPFVHSSVRDLLLDILHDLKRFPGSTRNLTDDQKEQLQMKACKAAIKAGKKLFPEEVSALVKDFIHSPSNYTCPHGRPLCLLFDQAKLESLFNRT